MGGNRRELRWGMKIRKSDNFKLAYRLTFYYLLYHILLVIAILFFADQVLLRIEKQFEQKYQRTVEESMEDLNQKILQLKDVLTLTMYGENMQILQGRKGQLTTYEEVELKLKVKNELTVLASQYSYIKDIGIYIPEYETWIDVGTWFGRSKAPEEQFKGERLELADGEICLRLGLQNGKEYTEGYVSLNSTELYKLLDQKLDQDIVMQISIDGKELTEVKEKEKYHVLLVESDIYPIEVRYYIPASLLSFRKYLYILGGIAILFLMITAIAFSRYLNRAIHRPLNNIVRFMESAKEQNYKEPAVHQGPEEFHYVTLEFNKMKEYLEYYTRHRYEQEIIMRQMELDHLQEQIKPHFLYNCFANISNLCKSYDVEKVEQLSRALSKYYSYITRTGRSLVTLQAEYTHMKNYLTIQKIRFEKRVQMEVGDLPAAAEQMLVPRLILQPVVENAYKYAFEHVETGGYLRIHTEEDEKSVRIIVEDSGYQTDEDTVTRTREALEKEGVNITGLGNLQKRLQFLHPENGMKIERSELGGIKNTVIIRKEEAERHV